MGGAEGLSPALWTRIRQAVLAELLGSGIDQFTIDGVARRAGLDPEFIRARWHDRRVLLMEVMLARTTESQWNPDTGSLHTDLEAVSALAIAISHTEEGRAAFRATLPGGPDVDLAEVAPDLWKARFRDAAQVLKRAGERGQLRDGVIPEDAIRMFAGAFYQDVIFADIPVRPEYAEQVVDVFLHGVLGAGGRDRPWCDVDQLARLRVAGQDAGQNASAADQALEVAHRAVVLPRAWADALIDPLVLMETVRDDRGRVVDFVYRDVNRAAYEEMDLTRAEMVGLSVSESSPYFERSGLLDLYARCAESGEPVVLNDFQYQHFDEHRRVDVRATNAGSGLIAVTWRIVTDRYEAAQREARYRTLMDHSPVPAGLTTADGRFISVNQAMVAMTGYDTATLSTMRWQDLTVPAAPEHEVEATAELLAGRRDTYRAVKRCVHAGGHLFEAEWLLACIRNDEGRIENLIAQVIDRPISSTGYSAGAPPT